MLLKLISLGYIVSLQIVDGVTCIGTPPELSALVLFRELEGILSDRHEDITNLHGQLASSRSRYKLDMPLR